MLLFISYVVVTAAGFVVGYGVSKTVNKIKNADTEVKNELNKL